MERFNGVADTYRGTCFTPSRLKILTLINPFKIEEGSCYTVGGYRNRCSLACTIVHLFLNNMGSENYPMTASYPYVGYNKPIGV